eukprot:4265132-Prymnesium_polylepis.1
MLSRYGFGRYILSRVVLWVYHMTALSGALGCLSSGLHMGMRVSCVWPRPKFSFPPPSGGHGLSLWTALTITHLGSSA